MLGIRYQLLSELGQGGMGIVHEAIDRQLDRHVAIKMILDAGHDQTSRARFLREARSAAAISHPNICQIYEIGEHEGQPFLVMELLQGEALSARLARGALPAVESVTIMRSVLSALGALHTKGVVHRDLKPSNIFLTPHGVKILDFGLARPTSDGDTATEANLTMPGTITGTLRYMAPEQLTGDTVDGRTDLWAAGIVLHEMLTGRLPFDADSTLDMLQAMLREPREPLAPVPGHPALDRILDRALQPQPSARYQNAEAMAAALAGTVDDALPVRTAPRIRLVVLPFRPLRADEDTAFLEGALPDAITTSLAGVSSLTVRSNVAALRFGAAVDLPKLATELDVNHVITGTLLRAGTRLRVTCQLVEAPGGNLVWSETTERPLGDLFELQDAIARHIVDALPLEQKTATRETRDVPANAKAYELYLRANALSKDGEGGDWVQARELYKQCVAEDPQFAPAWARLGRMHRIIGKYLEPDHRASFAAADEAFRRAFAINPNLSMAHHLFVYLEVETGRADEAAVHLVQRIQRAPFNAELYAALCQATRYCGLLDVSAAAGEKALRLDPKVPTSLINTYMALGDAKRAIALWDGGSMTSVAVAQVEAGEDIEKVRRAIEAEGRRFAPDTPSALFAEALSAVLGGDRDKAIPMFQRLQSMSQNFPDGEAMYQVARMLARVDAGAMALDLMSRSVGLGFYPVRFFERDPWLETVRHEPQYHDILARARERHVAAASAFAAAGGHRLVEN